MTPSGAFASPKEFSDERDRLAGVSELPAHDHHQRESEEKEQQRRDRVLDPDRLVILREDICAPEPRGRVVVRGGSLQERLMRLHSRVLSLSRNVR